MKKTVLCYAITFGVGLAAAFGIACAIGLFSSGDATVVMQKLSDACLAVGVVLFGVGLLIFCANHGAFDMLVWGLKSGLARLIPGLATKFGKKTYAEYKEERDDRKKPFVFMLLVGLCFIVLAVLFVILYFTL